jgi:hypothetical protein
MGPTKSVQCSVGVVPLAFEMADRVIVCTGRGSQEKWHAPRPTSVSPPLANVAWCTKSRSLSVSWCHNLRMCSEEEKQGTVGPEVSFASQSNAILLQLLLLLWLLWLLLWQQRWWLC